MARCFLTADWRHLAMLNYEIDPAVLRPLAPRGTELDCWNDRCFVSVVGFLFEGARLQGIPIPFHQRFEEVNLRFYVRRQERDGWRRGVVFIKEVVPRFAVAAVARWVYNENFVCCPMKSEICLPDAMEGSEGGITYRWRDGQTWHRLAATIAGEPAPPSPGSLDEFIAEHYWAYVMQRDGGTIEYRVEHPPWRAWRAASTEFDCDVAKFYGDQYVEALSGPPASAFVADGSAVRVFAGRRM